MLILLYGVKTNMQMFFNADVENEDFIVWMRTAGLPTFKKLNRRILSRQFNAGDVVSVAVQNIFPVSDFGGEKWMVLSTTSWYVKEIPVSIAVFPKIVVRHISQYMFLLFC